MGALDQADAEEALAEWLEESHIEGAWRIAPTFVSIGIRQGRARLRSRYIWRNLPCFPTP